MWGYPSDLKDPLVYWGARAIKENGYWDRRKGDYIPPKLGFSMLHDRQSCSGEEADRKDLVRWLNEKAMPLAQEWAKGESSDSEKVFEHREGEYRLMASCNMSCGYVYVGAWRDPRVRLHSQYKEGEEKNEGCIYGITKLADIPRPWKWSAKFAVPAIGSRVYVNMNDFGEGVVVSYFIEHGYVGVEVDLDRQPDWHVEEHGKGKHILVFGIEVKKVEEVTA